MPCSHEVIKTFELLIEGRITKIRGLDSMVHLTFLSQPQSDDDIKEMMYDAFLEYNEPYSGNLDVLQHELLNAYLEMKTELEDRIRRYRVLNGEKKN